MVKRGFYIILARIVPKNTKKTTTRYLHQIRGVFGGKWHFIVRQNFCV
jgi:hypothetical protein